MASMFKLEIATPDRKFFSGEVEMVVLKTPEGEMGVLKDHAPTVVAIAIGPIRILQNGEWLEAFLSEGFMEITKEKTVILCDTAEWPNEIDVNRAKAAKDRAEERLQRQLSQMEYIRSRTALARAMARLKVTKSIK
ncbi:F0F1 ATP synthase subunit epsilon [Pseudobacteroides cellulosolvens]|uniref:ATP synthase epsilon chain n=1 Tax=Pseudobacteroides cellulosolvens ATCC 35603 = DSM 2933 TaxID=398512 RepID=A0A0L6JSV4_9FIRM|nr:F0F1 ATP synthase subunit epsilon [Pseudobacteroides cellulosolvens]KNY28507.1 ATP synthase epsilon chain [Pseudobacteroides cellulosolvens ATCC 35603 = DSM 2933]